MIIQDIISPQKRIKQIKQIKKTEKQIKKMPSKILSGSLAILLVFQIIGGILFLPPIEESWADAPTDWLTGWDYRTPIEIDDNTEDLTDYQVQITLQGTDSSANNYVDFDKVLAGGADIRFTDSNKTTEIDFWIEEWVDTLDSESATIWLEVPSILTVGIKTVYVYYGKSDEIINSSGDNTFEFFDDFEGVITGTHNYSTVGSGLMSYYHTQGNHLYYYNNRTYIIYTESATWKVYVRYYDHTANEWSDAVYVGICGDNHASGTIVVDSSGHIHIVYGGHVDALHPIEYRCSTNPEDISSWSDPEILDTEEGSVYPQLKIGGDDTLYFIHRSGWAHNGNAVFRKKPFEGSWSSMTTLVEKEDIYVYPVYGFAIGEDGVIHLGINLYTSDYGYMKSDDGGETWKKSDGTDYTLPLNKTSIEKVFTGFSWLGSIAVSPTTNMPHIAVNSESTYHNISYRKWNGSEWTIEKTIVSDGWWSQLFFDSNGVLHLYYSNKNTCNLMHIQSTDEGGNWSAPEILLENPMEQYGRISSEAIIGKDNNTYRMHGVGSQYGQYGERLILAGLGVSETAYGLDTDKWTVNDAVIFHLVSGSKLTIDGCSDTQWNVLKGIHTSSFPLQNGFAVEVKDFIWKIPLERCKPLVGITLTNGTEYNKPIFEGLYDNWSENTSQKNVQIESNSYGSGEGSLPYYGEAQFKIIKKSDNNTEIFWDGTSILGPNLSTTNISKLYILVNSGWDFSGAFTMDSIFIRKYASAEPNSTTTSSFRSYDKIFSGITNTISATDYVSYSAEPSVSNLVDMTIVPASGSVDTSITTWNTSGTYHKKWTETGDGSTGNTSHTIGDLKADTYYAIKIDGTIFNTYLSNGSGEISFTYDGGYSDKEFEVEEDTTAPSLVGAPSFTTITTNSIVVNKPTVVTEQESGLYQWQARRDSVTELGLNAVATTLITDTLLSENTRYTYDAQFKDNASNLGNYGTTASKYTLADTPTNLTGSASIASMDLSVDGLPNHTNDFSGYYFENTTKGTNSDWIQTNFWQDTELSCGTQYTYTVKYRNGDGTETDSISLTQFTDSCGGGSTPVGSQNPPEPPISNPENPKGEFKILINNGDKAANNRTVNLKLFAGSDTTKMAISENPDFKNAILKPYQETKQWSLSYGDGVKTVYVKFYTKYGVESEVVSDSIVLGAGLEEEVKLKAPAENKPALPNEKTSLPETSIKKNIALNPIAITKNLGYGSNNNQVIQLQDKLKAINLFPKEIKSNGNFGPATKQAVKEFQKSVGIYPCGTVGPRTRKALNNQEFITNKDYQFTQDLKYNDKGEEVEQLQTRLRDQSFFPYYVKSTGWFGPITQKAVKLFQKFHGIIESGTVGDLVREKLKF